MALSGISNELNQFRRVEGDDLLPRRGLLRTGIAFAGALSMGGLSALGAATTSSELTLVSGQGSAPLDAAAEAEKVAFDTVGNREIVLRRFSRQPSR